MDVLYDSYFYSLNKAVSKVHLLIGFTECFDRSIGCARFAEMSTFFT